MTMACKNCGSTDVRYVGIASVPWCLHCGSANCHDDDGIGPRPALEMIKPTFTERVDRVLVAIGKALGPFGPILGGAAFGALLMVALAWLAYLNGAK